MKKAKKILIPIIAVICVVALGFASYGAYLLFGVYGIEFKRTYPQSAIVEENYDNRVKFDQTGTTVIDDEAQYQTMDGFGASACWWGQNVGRWDNCEDILALLYDDEKGIGLNVYRYNLGAGSADDESIYAVRSRTESFLKNDGTYDFTADANSQNALSLAKKIAGDDLRVTLFANSAPVSLTKNGRAYSSPPENADEPNATNLDPSNYGAYADYLYTVAEHFLNQGYKVTDVSPINEPQYAWRGWYNEDGSISMNQEGCFYSEQDALALYKVLIEKFKGSDIDEKGCKLSLFESGAAEGRNTVFSNYANVLLGRQKEYAFDNIPLRRYFDTISTHSYWSATTTKKRCALLLADKFPNYDVICTEYCQMTNDSSTGVIDLIEKEGATNGMTIEYGTAMADVIIDDLTILNAKEWDWWLGCSFGVYTDGLVYLNDDDHSDIQTSKRLWCLGNFSKFIDEGAVRIAAGSGVKKLPVCAFRNPDGSTVIVYSNSTENDMNTSIADIDFNSCEVYTTSAEYDLEKTADNTTLTDNVISIPSQSVVTVVLK